VSDGGGNHVLDVLSLREVGRNGEHRLASDLVRSRIEIRLSPRTDRDPRDLASDRERRRLAEPPARCGNDRDLALQSEIYASS
jgi:hypothetical protein